MIDKSFIDPNALQFYRMLKEAGFSAYFVGGSVRDLLLGKVPKDFDIATNATPHQIKRIIPYGRIIGRRFRHVMLERNGGRYEIVTFRGPIPQMSAMEEAEESLSTSLDEIEQTENHDPAAPSNDKQKPRFQDLNQFGTAEQDAMRRDFTINALFYDPDADELVDYVEGKMDVDRKIIRSIGDPMHRMEEDPIRILRAIRHKIKLGLEYDSILESAMKSKSSFLEQTSKDRIREEFLKVCQDQSLGDFLAEVKKLDIASQVMPWFEAVSEEQWEKGTKLWNQFKETSMEKPSPDMGLALMMVPLIEPLVLEPYKKNLPEGDKNYLPDMKYFLSCEPLRDFYLRNLRISRAQTDHVVRALFYFSRMTGLWLEQGPPRRVVGRLFQHPPAVLAAKMARIQFSLDGKETPPWILELAEFDPRKRRQNSRDAALSEEDNEREPESLPRVRTQRENRDTREVRRHSEHSSGEETRAIKSARLPTPDQPMTWNGPLHAPVVRPIFSEEQQNRWARKNQTVRAYRPSGIPNQPVDYALLKSNLVYNYKPEIETNASGQSEEDRRDSRPPRREHRDSRRRDSRENPRGSGRNNRHQQNNRGNPNRGPIPQGEISHALDPAAPEPQSSFSPRDSADEDSIGNLRRPGELPAALGDISPAYNDDNDIDDDIGNRLDGAPTSGHNPGAKSENLLTHQLNRGGHRGGPHHNRNNSNSQKRRGKRRGRRNGGPNRGPHKPNHDIT